MEPTHILRLIEECTGQKKLRLTVQEFADITGSTYQQVYKACRAGQLKHTQGGVKGRIRIDFREVGRVLEGQVAA